MQHERLPVSTRPITRSALMPNTLYGHGVHLTHVPPYSNTSPSCQDLGNFSLRQQHSAACWSLGAGHGRDLRVSDANLGDWPPDSRTHPTPKHKYTMIQQAGKIHTAQVVPRSIYPAHPFRFGKHAHSYACAALALAYDCTRRAGHEALSQTGRHDDHSTLSQIVCWYLNVPLAPCPNRLDTERHQLCT